MRRINPQNQAPTGVSTHPDPRREALVTWLHGLGFEVASETLRPLAGDASFRRYFRLTTGGNTQVVLDAPPPREDVGPFVAIAHALENLGLRPPKILAQDPDRGFLLLEDLGDVSYFDALRGGDVDDARADALYGAATASLIRLQLAGDPKTALLPPYDAQRLLGEMALFDAWFLTRHLQRPPSPGETLGLGATYQYLLDNARAQPQVWVHRDYHSRNLMVVDHDPQGRPGVLDFQDAVVGPVTYDLVSLFKDSYIPWPRERVEAWVLGHWRQLRRAGLSGLGDGATFLRWFDLMGLQRHLKVLGIFCRLYHRDGKPRYLQDLPTTLDYARQVSHRYPALGELAALLDAVELP